jgi:hypothetical protein
MPRQPGAPARRLQQGERARRDPRPQGEPDQPVAAPLQRRHDTVLPRAHIPVLPWPPAAVNVGSATSGEAAHPGQADIASRQPRYSKMGFTHIE